MLGLLSEAMQDNAATSWLQHHIHPTQGMFKNMKLVYVDLDEGMVFKF